MLPEISIKTDEDMRKTEETGFGTIKLIQDTDSFCYGIDAVILADFAYSACSSFRHAVDLGTGNGVIPLILSHKNREAVFTGIDVQEESVSLARESCRINGLEERMRFICADVLDLDGAYIDEADVVTCNPPYFAKGGGIPSARREKFIARHETTAVIDDFVRAASVILRGRGDFFMVHRPSRLVDIFCSCRKHLLEPKTVRFVIPKKGSVPNIVLIHCTAGAGKELRLMDDLCVYDENGQYTDEILRIYER